jgi:excisionase family DNA binding protein
LCRREVWQHAPNGGRREFGRRNAGAAVDNSVEADAQSQTVLLKPADVAARLAVSRTWLYDAAKTGRIPSIRIGGEDGPLRFVPEDIDRWLRDARSAWLPGRSPVATRRPIDPSDRLRVAS